MTHPKEIYQLKITLNDTHIPIWRKVLVPSEYTFEDLHMIIQRAFGWTNSHLHHFSILTSSGTMYIQSSNSSPEFTPTREEFLMSEEDTNLKNVMPTMVNKCNYEYDFGDSWDHKIELEKVLPYEKNAKYPQCIEGENACPPEDCGGPERYKELCKTLKNPKSEEYEGMIEWLGLESGKDFDPHEFNLEKADREVRKYV